MGRREEREELCWGSLFDLYYFFIFFVGDVVHTEEEKGSRWVFWWGEDEDEPEEEEKGIHVLGCGAVMIFLFICLIL